MVQRLLRSVLSTKSDRYVDLFVPLNSHLRVSLFEESFSIIFLFTLCLSIISSLTTFDNLVLSVLSPQL